MARAAAQRMLMWTGVDAWRAEASLVGLTPAGVQATGTQIGVDPVAYRLDYRLEAADGFVTRRLELDASGQGWTRRLDLCHDGHGGWTCDAQADGDPGLPPPGGDVGPVQGALDCDLGRSPVTNLMPVRRHELHQRPGARDFLMAWISVPDLGLHPSRQRYEHVRSDERGAIVRYVGEHRDFVGELELDADGLVVFYPELARRVDPP